MLVFHTKNTCYRGIIKLIWSLTTSMNFSTTYRIPPPPQTHIYIYITLLCINHNKKDTYTNFSLLFMLYMLYIFICNHVHCNDNFITFLNLFNVVNVMGVVRNSIQDYEYWVQNSWIPNFKYPWIWKYLNYFSHICNINCGITL